MVDVEAAENEPLVLALQCMASPHRVEHEGVALEEPGQLLVTGLPDPVGAAARQAIGLDPPGPHLGLGQLGVDPVDVRLLDGDLTVDLVGDEGRGH